MRIEDYALIGDCQTAALVHINGSIDWLCWPNFDSEACFARLIGTSDNGFWKLAPDSKRITTTRQYQHNTLILETTHTTHSGQVIVTDFMPVAAKYSQVVRMVRGVRGRVRMCSEVTLRFGYGMSIPWVTRQSYGIRAVAGPDAVELHTDAPLKGENMRTVSRFTVKEGETVAFTLMCGAYADYGEQRIDERPSPSSSLRKTRNFWKDWASRATFQGPYRDLVVRSLVTLKALTFAPTGGIVAAPTTSLPEWIGGTRNWDYRYCWLRDTSFTLFALKNAGYHEEAREWTDWLRRTIAGSPEKLQVMYRITGERAIPERELDHLAGFANSKPVRVGNGAADQIQLDIFGEVLDSFYWAFKSVREDGEEEFARLRVIVKRLESIWDQPDSGIWEVRGKCQHFTFSKMMAWIAFDRAIRIAQEHKLRAPLAQWKKLRETIHTQICDRAFNKRLNSFTQAYDSTTLDAAALILVIAGFLPPDDPRMIGTVDAVGKALLRNGFIMRYQTSKTDDGVEGTEGCFLACSFWYVRALKLVGRDHEAMEMFTRLCKLPNDVGLLAEEYDPKGKRMLGNFPQAFSHISLINTAFALLQPTEGTLNRAGLANAASAGKKMQRGKAPDPGPRKRSESTRRSRAK